MEPEPIRDHHRKDMTLTCLEWGKKVASETGVAGLDVTNMRIIGLSAVSEVMEGEI